MKTVRFTQEMNTLVSIEADVPDDWTDEDTYNYAQELSLSFTVEEDLVSSLDDDEVVITGISLDSVYLTDTHLGGQF